MKNQKLENIDFNIVVNNIRNLIINMYEMNNDSGVTHIKLPNNNNLVINIDVKPPFQIIQPGVDCICSNS